MKYIYINFIKNNSFVWLCVCAHTITVYFQKHFFFLKQYIMAVSGLREGAYILSNRSLERWRGTAVILHRALMFGSGSEPMTVFAVAFVLLVCRDRLELAESEIFKSRAGIHNLTKIFVKNVSAFRNISVADLQRAVQRFEETDTAGPHGYIASKAVIKEVVELFTRGNGNGTISDLGFQSIAEQLKAIRLTEFSIGDFGEADFDADFVDALCVVDGVWTSNVVNKFLSKCKTSHNFEVFGIYNRSTPKPPILARPGLNIFRSASPLGKEN